MKVVVDAYNGDTTYYAMDKDDPVLETYRGIYPTLFKDGDKMPNTQPGEIILRMLPDGHEQGILGLNILLQMVVAQPQTYAGLLVQAVGLEHNPKVEEIIKQESGPAYDVNLSYYELQNTSTACSGDLSILPIVQKA